MTPFPARLGQEASGGCGEYDQWAEVEPDGTGGWTDETNGRTHTNTGESLRESNGVTGIPSDASTGKIVWVQIEYGTATQYSFHYPGDSEGDATDAVASAVLHDEWFDVQGNESWFDIDTRNWNGRFISASVIYDSGAPIDNGSWNEAKSEHRNYSSGIWITQEANRFFRNYLTGEAATQEFTRIDTNVGGSSTTFIEFRKNTDGHLQMQVTLFNIRHSVRLTVQGRKRRSAADAIDVT